MIFVGSELIVAFQASPLANKDLINSPSRLINSEVSSCPVPEDVRRIFGGNTLVK
jgi:hypothetical protein